MKNIFLQNVAKENGVAFGTSGVRGLVAQMSPEICAAYTAAFLQIPITCSRRTVAVGMDLRPSSPEIARACIFAIELAGFDVEFCGVLPTPALAFYAMQEGIPAVMVTGSHIPFDRNGIKYYRPDGEITKTDEVLITNACVALPDVLDLPALPPVSPDAQRRYHERYTKFFPQGMLKGMRLGFYQHSSVARDSLTAILVELGAEVTSLGRTDEFVPIDTEAVAEEDVTRGKQWAATYGFDALISTDGDADRPLLGDELGCWFRGDVVGLLCARYLQVDFLAIPVSCTTAVERSGWFKRVLRTRIGSPYVIEGMQLAQSDGRGTVAGFEANGGFLLGTTVKRESGALLEPLPTRDAVLPLLALLALAHDKHAPLSALTGELSQRFTASNRIQSFAVERSRSILASLQADPAPLVTRYGALRSLDTTDGARFCFANEEIVHLRPSGNAPELRCYAEADNAPRAERLVGEVLELVGTL